MLVGRFPFLFFPRNLCLCAFVRDRKIFKILRIEKGSTSCPTVSVTAVNLERPTRITSLGRKLGLFSSSIPAPKSTSIFLGTGTRHFSHHHHVHGLGVLGSKAGTGNLRGFGRVSPSRRAISWDKSFPCRSAQKLTVITCTDPPCEVRVTVTRRRSAAWVMPPACSMAVVTVGNWAVSLREMV